MADVWNPFDPKNPVYVKLEKETAVNRRTWQWVIGIMGGLYIIDQYTKGNPHYYRARSKIGLGSVTKYKRYKIIRK